MNFELLTQLLLGMVILASSCGPRGTSPDDLTDAKSNPGLTVRSFWLRSLKGDEQGVSQLVTERPPSFDRPCPESSPVAGSIELRSNTDSVPLKAARDSGETIVEGPFGSRLDPESPTYSVYSRARLIYIDKYVPAGLLVESVSEYREQAKVTVIYNDRRFPNGIREFFYLIRGDSGWRIVFASDREDTIPNPSFGISDPECNQLN